MTTYYVSTSGDDNNNGTSPSTPFAHAPSNIMKDVEGSSTAEGITLSSGDIIKFKRGDWWRYVGFLWLYQRSGLTLTSYYNADGSDDPDQPLPVFDNTYERTGVSWTNDTGVDTNAWKYTWGSGTYGILLDQGFDTVFGTQAISADFTVNGDTEYEIPWSTEPDWLFDRVVSVNVPLVRGTAGSLAAGEWDWVTDTLYVKDDPTGGIIMDVTLTGRKPWAYISGEIYVYSPQDPSTEFSYIGLLTRGATDSRDGNSYRQNSWGMIINESDNLVITNLDLRYSESAQVYIVNGVADTALENITIANCSLGSFARGIYFLNTHASYQPSGLSFINNSFHRDWSVNNNMIGGTEAEPGGNGLSIYGGCKGALVRNNSFSGWGHDCISVHCDPAANEGMVIEGNEFLQGGSNYCRAFGISHNTTGKLADMEFRYNLDMTNQKNKIQGTNCKYHHNIFHKYNPSTSPFFGQVSTISEGALQVKSDTNMVSEGLEIFNNTIYNCGGSAILFVNQNSTTLGDNSFYNNLLLTTGWDTNTASVDRYAIRHDHQTGSFGTQLTYNNLIYDFRSQGTVDDVFAEDSAGLVTRTNAEAEAAFTYWYDNIVADPVLDGGYIPAINSPVVGAGAFTDDLIDAYGRPVIGEGTVIGAVGPYVNTSKNRRKL